MNRSTDSVHKVRRLGRAEWCNWLLDKAISTNFVVKLEVAGELDIERFRIELNKAIERNPVLKLRCRAGWWSAYFVDTGKASDVPVQLLEGEYGWREVAAAEVDRKFDVRVEQPLRVTLLKSQPGKTAIIATFFHAHADARSAALLLMEVLGCCDGLSPGPQRTVVESMENGFAPLRRGILRPFFVLRYISFLMSQVLRYGMPVKLKSIIQRSRGQGREYRVTGLSLTPESTSALLSKCRQEGTTLHGALMAAVLQAQREVFSPEIGKTQGLVCPVDVRPYLQPPRTEGEIGYHIAMPQTFHRMDSDKGFWEVAREARQALAQQIARRDAFHTWDILPAPFLTGSSGFGAKILLAATELSAQMTVISNIGNLGSGNLGEGLKINDIHFLLGPSPAIPFICTASSIGGRLAVNLTYDRNALEPDQVKHLVEHIQKCLQA